MSYSTYPTAEELETFLSGQGLTLPSGYDIELDTLSAAEWWEDTTGWKPFLAEAVSATYTLNPPVQRTVFGNRLRLDFGMYTLTEVKTGLDVDGTGGDVMTENEQYRPVYWNEEAQTGWIVAIDMVGGWGSGWRSVSITGRKGCQADLDALVYRALLLRGALTAYGNLTGNQGRLKRIKQGPREDEYETKDTSALGILGSIVAGWDVFCTETAMRYQKDLV